MPAPATDAVPATDLLRTLSVREASGPLQRLEDKAWEERTTVSDLVRRSLRATFPDVYAADSETA